jgi:hypothetical protein
MPEKDPGTGELKEAEKVLRVILPHTGFWGDQTYGWHYDLLFVVANLVILTTGGGRLVLL